MAGSCDARRCETYRESMPEDMYTRTFRVGREERVVVERERVSTE